MIVFRIFAEGFRDIQGRFAKASDEKVKEFCIPVGAVWWSIKTKGTSVWAGRKYGGPSIGPIPNLFHARAFAKVGLAKIDETARRISTGIVGYLTR